MAAIRDVCVIPLKNPVEETEDLDVPNATDGVRKRDVKEAGFDVSAELKRRKDRLAAMREGKAVPARRKATVETVIGVIKEVAGFLPEACGEWNLKRMHAPAAST